MPGLTTVCVTVTNTDQCVPGAVLQCYTGAVLQCYTGAVLHLPPTTTGSGQPCQISQRTPPTLLLPPSLQLKRIRVLLPSRRPTLIWVFCRQSPPSKQPALPYKGHDRPSFPPGKAMIALRTDLPSATKSSAIISYHSQRTRKQIQKLWTLKHYWLSILAFVSPRFCLSDSQFLVLSASSCLLFSAANSQM